MPEEGTNVATLMPKPRYRPNTPSVAMTWRAMRTPFMRGGPPTAATAAPPCPLIDAVPMLPASANAPLHTLVPVLM